MITSWRRKRRAREPPGQEQAASPDAARDRAALIWIAKTLRLVTGAPGAARGRLRPPLFVCGCRPRALALTSARPMAHPRTRSQALRSGRLRGAFDEAYGPGPQGQGFVAGG
jgi:hypothetical protein